MKATFVAPLGHRLIPAVRQLLVIASVGCSHGLALTTGPGGASVSVGGKILGRTPLSLSASVLQKEAQNGSVRVSIEKAGFRPIDIILPKEPSRDRLSIALTPFREDASAARSSPSDGGNNSATPPVAHAQLEVDLLNLTRFQEKLFSGETLDPLPLAYWRNLYPTSGAAPFLEAMRSFREGQIDNTKELLEEAVKRNDRDMDFRAVQRHVENLAAKGG